MHRTHAALVAIALALVGCSDASATSMLEAAGVCVDPIEQPPSEDTVGCHTSGGHVVLTAKGDSEVLRYTVATMLDEGGRLPLVVGDGWVLSGTDRVAFDQVMATHGGQLISDPCDGQLWLEIPPTAC